MFRTLGADQPRRISPHRIRSRRPRRRLRSEAGAGWRGAAHSGAAALELAVVLPLLMVLASGACDFGRISRYSIAVNQAANEAARFGATHQFTSYTHSTWRAAIENVAEDAMIDLPGFDTELLTVAISTQTLDDDVLLSVTVTYPFETVMRWPGMPTSVVVRSSMTVLQYR